MARERGVPTARGIENHIVSTRRAEDEVFVLQPYTTRKALQHAEESACAAWKKIQPSVANTMSSSAHVSGARGNWGGRKMSTTWNVLNNQETCPSKKKGRLAAIERHISNICVALTHFDHTCWSPGGSKDHPDRCCRRHTRPQSPLSEDPL